MQSPLHVIAALLSLFVALSLSVSTNLWREDECVGLSEEECRSVVWGSSKYFRRDPDACVYAQRICGGQAPGQPRFWEDPVDCMRCYIHNVDKMGGFGAKEGPFLTWATEQCWSGCVPSAICKGGGRCSYHNAGCGKKVLCRCRPGFKCRESLCVRQQQHTPLLSCPCPWGFNCRNSSCWRTPPPSEPPQRLGPSGWEEGPDLFGGFGKPPTESRALSPGPAPLAMPPFKASAPSPKV